MIGKKKARDRIKTEKRILLEDSFPISG